MAVNEKVKKPKKPSKKKVLKKRYYDSNFQFCPCEECLKADPERRKFIEKEFKAMRTHLKRKAIPD